MGWHQRLRVSFIDTFTNNLTSQEASRFGGDIDTKLMELETAHQHLYAAGARNFLFIDLPPIQRSPGTQRASEFGWV